MLIVLSFLTTSIFAQQEKKLSLGEQPVFKVTKVSEPMVIDGKMDEVSWSKTEARTLDYFYRVDKPTDQQKSTFRMLWGKEKFYLFFEMEDQYITARETKRDGQPYLDDCAEIFFITAPDSLDTHFGYELNLNKAVNDFIFF
ncbi:carbohydrate-binding family 9-like protein [Zobellia nedashkovskayae]